MVPPCDGVRHAYNLKTLVLLKGPEDYFKSGGVGVTDVGPVERVADAQIHRTQ